MNQHTQSSLDSQFGALDRNFDTLRDLVRSSGLSDVSVELLSLVALKFICDSYIGYDAESAKKGFQVASDWPTVVRNVNVDDVGERLLKLAYEVENHYESLEGIFTRSLLTDLPHWPGTFLHRVIFQLSTFSMSFLGEDDVGVFGHWFDRCLSMLMESDLTSGLSVTPRSIAELMVKLADLRSGLSILDPTCGVGAILACCAKVVCRPKRQCSLFGQEINIRSWALCKLRLFLLQYTLDHFALGDALRQPAFGSSTDVKRFDRVICDPPLGMDVNSEELHRSDPYHRFKFLTRGRLSGESAFVQHVISSLASDGIGIVLVSHSFLFRAGIDVRLREELIRDGYIKAVIGLPGKLRIRTSIETALIVLQKDAHPYVMFIDAAALQQRLRGRSHISAETIETIWELLDSGEERIGVSRLASFEEVAKTGYSLVPKHYIDLPTQAPPNVELLRKELRSWESEHEKIVEEMDRLVRTLEQEL